MDFHILAIIIAIFMFALAPSAFASAWAKAIARGAAVILAIWGLSAFHPLVLAIVISLVIAVILYYGIAKVS